MSPTPSVVSATKEDHSTSASTTGHSSGCGAESASVRAAERGRGHAEQQSFFSRESSVDVVSWEKSQPQALRQPAWLREMAERQSIENNSDGAGATDYDSCQYQYQNQDQTQGSQQGQSSTDIRPLENTLGREIIMAINVKGRSLGCSYYDGYLSKLFVMQDMVECISISHMDCNNSGAVNMIQTIKVQVRPTLILTNTRLDENFLNTLKFDDTGRETKIEVRPGGDFSYPVAKSKLISVSINKRRSGKGSMSSTERGPLFSELDESTQEAQLQLSNVIDLQSVESVGCAGAIISFLSRHGVFQRASKVGQMPPTIFAIESFAVESFMFINPNSLSSLQVFEDESHPSMHSSIRGRKEGLSLFGILNQTKTSQGKYLLKQWLLRPSLDFNVIHARHQTVECFVRTENQATVGQLANCLLHIKNIPKVLEALPRKATIAEWQAILQIMLHFIVKDLSDIGSFIHDVLDFDESAIEGRCVVKRNVDEELDRMRQTYHGLGSFLSEIAKEISLTIPSDFASTINVIYFPQLGYLITVPMNPNWKTDQDFYQEGLSYQFSTESTVYYKNDAMRDREIDILQGLQERILEYTQLLITCSDLCAELDVHPLQELVVNSFVANNTHLGEPECISSTAAVASTTDAMTDRPITGVAMDAQSHSERDIVENRVMILSGANSSGKSVYLKQVALIIYMAHIGSFVPAESAVIGLTDKILTRLQTRETVSSIQSAFMTDLQQVTLALKLATKRSLVVLDEFGKGTTSTDGAGMFCGVIEHFAKRTSDRPRVIATTHFHELFENQLLNMDLPISLSTMEVCQESNCLEATFLFRVIGGKTPSSLGPACAAMANMPTSIVQRGLSLSGLFRRYEMVIPMLTEHELKMQRMYEQLTGMLLHLQLDHLDVDLSDDSAVKPEDYQRTQELTSEKKMPISDTRSSIEGADSTFSRVVLGKKRDRGDIDDSEGLKGFDWLDRAVDQLLDYAMLVNEEEQAKDEF
ncbi:MutS protein msh5 [Dissophora ornata]|nr:MutS protein msh5 [Dissophora ornata]